MIMMFDFDITNASFFNKQNVIDFLNKDEDLTYDFKFFEIKKMKKLS